MESKCVRSAFPRAGLCPAPAKCLTLENCFRQFVQHQEIGWIAHIVIGFDQQNVRHHSRLGEMTLGRGIAQIGGNVVGYICAIVVASLISRKCR